MRRTLLAAAALLLIGASAAQAAPELSVSHRLEDRRYDVAGERARAIGFEDGRFYANGWHITGEMGGVWTEPLKLVDGVWFGIDGEWVGPATQFTSGWGYAKLDLPPAAGLTLQRTDFVPDGHRAALFGLKMTNPGATSRTVTVKVDAHSELMTEYPWAFSGPEHNASQNLPDSAQYDAASGALVFRDQGKLPHANAPQHDYAALVASPMTPVAGETGASPNEYRGPQGTNVCSAEERPNLCDDGPFGKGKGGQLRYEVTVPAGASRTLWVAAAGSDKGPAAAAGRARRRPRQPRRPARGEDRRARALGPLHPARAARRRASRGGRRLGQAEHPRPDPGRRGPADPLDGPGEGVPAAAGVGRARPLGGRRVPRLSVDVRHGRRVHGVCERRGRPVRGDRGPPACIAPDLGHPQRPLGGRDPRGDLGRLDLVRQGLAPHRSSTGEVKYDFNTDETVKFPSAVALLWRWSGDNAFRDAMYDFSKRNLRYVVKRLDEDGDGWPEGSGNVERSGMGVEKLDNTVYLIRGLYDLADMARSKHDGRTQPGRATSPASCTAASRPRGGWRPSRSTPIRSTTRPTGGPNNQQQDQHWIGVTPMEAELDDPRRPRAGTHHPRPRQPGPEPA